MSGALQAVFQNQRSFITVPGAPTIGTATATGATSATVAFTAPASNGGAVITLYTATSSPGSITGTLAQAGSGTITVSNLSPSTSYTFTVKATNSIGQSAASGASNSITTSALAIGDAFGGGYYGGQVSSGITYNMIIGPVSGASSSLQWKTSNTDTTGTSSDIDGAANSNSMNNASHPAAQFCKAVSAGGYSDWYMPAKNELEIFYYNLKPAPGAPTIPNDTYSGANSNAVPSRGNYTAGTPNRTSVSIFQEGNAQAFNSTGGAALYYYWASTQNSATYSKVQSFRDGTQGATGKSYSRQVRAVRKVAA